MAHFRTPLHSGQLSCHKVKVCLVLAPAAEFTRDSCDQEIPADLFMAFLNPYLGLSSAGTEPGPLTVHDPYTVHQP